MKNRLSDDQDYNLWVLLHQVKDLMFIAREKELDKYGISTMQAGVLFILNALGGKSTTTEISNWILRAPHSVSSLLNRMEREGLVKKVRDLGKKTQLNIILTEKGKRAFVDSGRRESIHDIMSCLSEHERQQLWSALGKLRNKALEKKVSKLPFP